MWQLEKLKKTLYTTLKLQDMDLGIPLVMDIKTHKT
jgi:hypothetical protein